MKNTLLRKILIISFAFCFILLLIEPFRIFSQQNINQILYNPPAEQPKGIFEIIFNLSEMNRGTKFAQNPKEKSSVIKKINQDSGKKENRIESIRETDKGDKFKIFLKLEDNEQKITIDIYNLLGKKVIPVWDAYPPPEISGKTEYEFSSVSLPNGIYLCVVLGKNFRLREKFYVKR